VANLAPLTIALMVKPTIEKPEDLRGKKIGVPRLGAVAHFAIRMILDRHGIKDLTILQMGSQPEAAAGMRRAAIDGAMISLPLNYVLAKEGFRELVGPQDYRRLGIQFISQGISARKSFAAKNRDVVLRLMKATMEGMKLMSTEESLAKKILRRTPAKPIRSRSIARIVSDSRCSTRILRFRKRRSSRWFVSWPTSISLTARQQRARHRRRSTTTVLSMK
jgi:ABC-type nitrate/sulfonate/bicarbonate transport system substrate-binding protein